MKKTAFLFCLLALVSCTCLPQIPRQYIQADQNCEGVLPNYLEFITVKNNCQGVIPTQDPLPGTILDAANPWLTVTIEAKDISGNIDQKKFDVLLMDNIPPELIIDSLGFTDTIAYRRNDIGEWGTIFYQDFEHHDAPIHYTSDNEQSPPPNLFSLDFNGEWFRNSDYRWPPPWEGLFQDSIVADPLFGSKVLKFSESDTVIDSYNVTTSFRGGDTFSVPLNDDDLTEIYFSYNIMFKPGFLWNWGGKLSGLRGGTPVVEGKVPVYGEGFNANIMWFHSDYPGSPVWYLYHQDQPDPSGTGYYPGESILWEQFHPEGENLNYQGPRQAFVFDISEPIWYNITIRCVVNTFTGETSDANGILEGFINGKLIAQRTNLNLITYPDRETGKFRLFIRYFHGGGGPPLREEWLLMDDILVFTYDVSVDVPRGNEPSPPGRVLNLPNWPKEIEE